MKILAISLAAALVVFLLAYSFIVIRVAPQTQMQRRLKEIKYGRGAAAPSRSGRIAEIPFVERIIVPAFLSLERRLARFAPASIREMLEIRILRAGKQGEWSVNALLGVWILSVAVGGVVAFLFTDYSGMAALQRMAALVIGIAVGAGLPFAFLNTLIHKRQAAIFRQLPEFLDILSVSVQAGLSFEGAVAKMVARMKGPLIDECERMQRDTRLGVTRKRALQQMAKRCDLQDVYLFTTAIIQSERLGTSVANTLTVQADNMRERRRQYVKAQALKAPIKIILPLALFIFPAFMVAVMLPPMLKMMASGGF